MLSNHKNTLNSSSLVNKSWGSCLLCFYLPRGQKIREWSHFSSSLWWIDCFWDLLFRVNLSEGWFDLCLGCVARRMPNKCRLHSKGTVWFDFGERWCRLNPATEAAWPACLPWPVCFPKLHRQGEFHCQLNQWFHSEFPLLPSKWEHHMLGLLYKTCNPGKSHFSKEVTRLNGIYKS